MPPAIIADRQQAQPPPPAPGSPRGRQTAQGDNKARDADTKRTPSRAQGPGRQRTLVWGSDIVDVDALKVRPRADTVSLAMLSVT
jgi:hypothetical protein